MTRIRKITAILLLAVVVAVSGLTAALATDEDRTYAYLPDHSVYFYDVAGNYAWARREVDTLAMNGVVQGSGEHLFYPERSITRADFIVMLDRAYGMSKALAGGLVSSQGTFSDVPQNTYYYQAVTAAKALGIATGTMDNRFLPQQSMTRQDAMVFLKRTLDRTQLTLPHGSLGAFADAGQVSAYAQDAVSSLVAAQVIGGSNGKLTPKSNVTRAQMAVMLYRATHLEERAGGAVYTARGDRVNICIGAQSYCDVIIENYDPSVQYSDLMRYTALRQENGVMYVTLEEKQPIDRTGNYLAGQFILDEADGTTTAYPVSSGCAAIDVSAPYHQLRTLVSTGGVYAHCYPSIVNGVVTAVYYSKT